MILEFSTAKELLEATEGKLFISKGAETPKLEHAWNINMWVRESAVEANISFIGCEYKYNTHTGLLEKTTIDGYSRISTGYVEIGALIKTLERNVQSFNEEIAYHELEKQKIKKRIEELTVGGE